jgi:Leucine-rich repeat (LRR) protein
LKELPLSIGQLNAFQKLNLSWCSNLKELPSSIGQLNALQKFDLTLCFNLKELPSSISKLNALQKLDLTMCSNWKSYPHLLANWMRSKSLIWQCVPTERVTLIYWPIECAPKVWFDNVFQPKELPSSIGQLNAFQKLNLTTCSNWKNYLHLLANWMHSKCLIYHGVLTWMGYLHRLVNWMHSKCLICKGVLTWKHREKNTFIYGWIECIQSASFVKVF